MPGKMFRKLGKTKIMRLPEGIEDFVKKLSRELDTKEDPKAVMELIAKVVAMSK